VLAPLAQKIGKLHRAGTLPIFFKNACRFFSKMLADFFR